MGYVAELPGLREVAGHEREGFVLAHLAAPQGPDRSGVERVAGQGVAAEALDGDDGGAPRGRGPDAVGRGAGRVVAAEALDGDGGASAQYLGRARDGIAQPDPQLV